MARDPDTACHIWVVYAYSDKRQLWELRGFRRFHRDHMPYRSRERTRRKFHIGKHAPMHLTYLGNAWNDTVQPDYAPPTHVPKQFVGPKLMSERIESRRTEQERQTWSALPIDLQIVRGNGSHTGVSRRSRAIHVPEYEYNEATFLRIVTPFLRPLNKNGRYHPLPKPSRRKS